MCGCFGAFQENFDEICILQFSHVITKLVAMVEKI